MGMFNSYVKLPEGPGKILSIGGKIMDQWWMFRRCQFTSEIYCVFFFCGKVKGGTREVVG
jgi:hypothetical protein